MVHAYDFSECYINLGFIQPGQKAVDLFPELRGIPEFKNSAAWYEFPIIACIADVKSPFREIKDLRSKLDEIFAYWEITKTIKKQREFYEALVTMNDENIRNMICCYLKMLGSHMWTSYFALYQTFYQLTKILMEPLPADSKQAQTATAQKLSIQRQMADVQETLAKYESALFNDDRLKRLLVNQELTKIVSYPEKHAMEGSII